MTPSAPSGPFLLLDIDGPLNPYASPPSRRPEGYQTHRFLTPRRAAAERARLSAWGMPHKRPKPLRVWLNPDHGRDLAALPFELVWATTWEEEANSFVAPALGLPELPYITWQPTRSAPEDGVFWKTPEIVAWAAGQPFAWLDDEITDADRAWVAIHHPGPALLRRVDPRIGLRSEDFAALASWASASMVAASSTAAKYSNHRDRQRPLQNAADRLTTPAALSDRSAGSSHRGAASATPARGAVLNR